MKMVQCVCRAIWDTLKNFKIQNYRRAYGKNTQDVEKITNLYNCWEHWMANTFA